MTKTLKNIIHISVTVIMVLGFNYYWKTSVSSCQGKVTTALLKPQLGSLFRSPLPGL